MSEGQKNPAGLIALRDEKMCIARVIGTSVHSFGSMYLSLRFNCGCPGLVRSYIKYRPYGGGYLCGCYSTAIFMFSLPILATTTEPDCAAKDVVPLMAVAEPRALPSMP